MSLEGVKIDITSHNIDSATKLSLVVESVDIVQRKPCVHRTISLIKSNF